MTEGTPLVDSWVELKKETIAGDLLDRIRATPMSKFVHNFSLRPDPIFSLQLMPLLERLRSDWLRPFQKQRVIEVTEASGIRIPVKPSPSRRF